MAAITIKLTADFLFTRPQTIRLEFTDPKTGDVLTLEGLVRLEEIEASLDEESLWRRSRAVSRFLQPSGQRERIITYEGHYEIAGVSSKNLKDADSAAGTKPKRVVDLQDISI